MIQITLLYVTSVPKETHYKWKCFSRAVLVVLEHSHTATWKTYRKYLLSSLLSFSPIPNIGVCTDIWGTHIAIFCISKYCDKTSSSHINWFAMGVSLVLMQQSGFGHQTTIQELPPSLFQNENFKQRCSRTLSLINILHTNDCGNVMQTSKPASLHEVQVDFYQTCVVLFSK